MKTLNLKNKNILLTGGDGFLGRVINRVLIAEGAYVISTDAIKSMTSAKMDISDTIDVYNYVTCLRKEGIILDGLINNAAVSFKGNKVDPELFAKTMDVNVKGTYNCITQFERILGTNASIVNIASMYGMISPDFSAYEGNEDQYSSSSYGASKAAIIQMTKYYANQLAPIRVNAVSPGGIMQGHDDNFTERYAKRVPLKRMAEPEEIVDAILFLLSPLSSYITGHNLPVTGGIEIL